MSALILRRSVSWAACVLVVVTAHSTVVVLAPMALADPAANLRGAIASARGETACGPFRYSPVVEQAAEVVNRSTDDYLAHTTTRVPIDDPLAGLKDLGYRGNKAYLLQGAGKSDTLAIKGAVLEGYAAIPDCSYTDFGVSMRRNETTGYNLASVVLAGA